MSKSSTTASKNPPPQLPTKSAWSKGPPPNTTASPRSQSPAPSPSSQPVQFSHSRRPSALGQGIPIKDGVSIPKSNIGVAKQGTAVTFGSIGDDASLTISSSPTVTPAIPAIKAEAVKSFGTVPAVPPQANGKVNVPAPKPVLGQQATASSSSAASSSASTPAPPSTPAKLQKMDIAKLFQTAPPAPPSSTTESASKPSSSSPSQQPGPSTQPPPPVANQPGSSQMPPYSPYMGPNGMRPQPQNGGGAGRGGPPGSPVYSRQQIPNGSPARHPGPSSGPGGPQQMPSGGMPSPRLAPMAAAPPPQPGPPMMWGPGGYYYMDPNYMGYTNGWYGVPPIPHPQQHGHPPPPHPTMPMSPRNPSIPPPGAPGTPTLAHAAPVAHPPHPPPMTHSSSSSVSGITSTPPTPSTASLPNNRLNTAAVAFVPSTRTSKISIKSQDGTEVNVNDLKFKGSNTPTTATPSSSLASGPSPTPSKRVSVRLESPADKAKREAEEKAKTDAEDKARKAKEEKEKKAKEDKEKAEREAERRRKEEEEQERRKKEEQEKEKQRKLEEELKEKLRKEGEERKRKEEEERLEKERAEKEKADAERRKKEEEAKEKERIAKEKEEQERQRKEEEDKKRQREKEEEEAKKRKEEEAAKEQREPVEEGEIVEEKPGNVTPKEEKPKPKDTLKIDTAPHSEGRKRPGHLDLSAALKPNIPAALPSALATARIIEDLNVVSYPEGIKSPRIELNVGAKDGKFRYDRDFLMQFMSICKEKPDNLPPLDAIGLEPADQSSFAMSRGGSQRHRDRTLSGASTRSASSGFPGAPFAKGGIPGFPPMGNFAPPSSKLGQGDAGFAGNANRSVSTSAATMHIQRNQMTRTASVGGSGSSSGRTRSKRGEKRNEGNKVGNQSHGSSFGPPGGIGINGLEPVAPLQQTANRWDRRAIAVEPDSPEIVDRKVKGLLNKLTMEKFDSISDQIIDWANKSEKEKDGRTLIQVIRLVFEKATDEATWSEMYARLCRKMMETISPAVQDEGIRNAEGKPIAGGQLFRKYLLNRCQEDFERGWAAKEATAAAAAPKAKEDQAAASNNTGEEEVALYSDEYYAAQKAKRQGLGLIKFIGELFKLQMLTERIMHECIKKLLGNVDNPEEEEIESLCKLLTTVGSILDTSKARGHLDIYFSRMKELTKSPNVSSRMQFMLQDVIELRERKWTSRNQVAAPTTIAQVHQEAAKDRAAQDKESYQRQLTLSMSRGGSKHGKERPESYDGWNVAGGNQPRPPPKAGDLSKFGKISSTSTPVTFGPASVFSGKKESKKDPSSLSRTNSSSNMFSMLSSQGDSNAEKAPEAAPPQRKKLALLPRTLPKAAPAAPEQEPESSSSEEEEEMSVADAEKKIKEDTKEFFAIRNIEEAEVYFIKLPAVHHHILVDKLVSLALESKEADAQLVCDFFTAASSKGLCSPESFETAFLQLAEFLDDIAIDAPKAPRLMAIMLKGPALTEEQRKRISSKSPEHGEAILDA